MNNSENGKNISRVDRIIVKAEEMAEKMIYRTEDAALRITEIRSVRIAARIAVIPAFLYGLGVLAGDLPGTRESFAAGELVFLASLAEIVAESELPRKNNS